MSMISISIIQFPLVFLNLAASVDRTERLIREASRDGADVVVLPEAWLPGYLGRCRWKHIAAVAGQSRSCRRPDLLGALDAARARSKASAR
jgi:predicted amidohydrolase